MKKTTYTALVLCSAMLLTAGNVAATPFGSNITIYDGAGYQGTGQGGEDGETEPGMVNNQGWDLEGFFLNGNNLSMVGGYDFVNGNSGYASGDIFISTDNIFGNDGTYTPVRGNNIVNSNFGYEYVIDLDFGSNSYNVLFLAPTAATITAYYPANENGTPGSNPWQYSAGGELVTSGYFDVLSGLNDTDAGFAGGSHYALTGLDLSFLGLNTEFYSHFTMGCGNDNLMGQGANAPVPEPATMLLFGTGLVGIGLRGAAARKRKK